MARTKKKAKTYNTYAAGGQVNPMTFDEVKENLKNGTLKLSKKSFAYGGKMFTKGGQAEMKKAEETKTPKAKKGMFFKKKKK